MVTGHYLMERKQDWGHNGLEFDFDVRSGWSGPKGEGST